MARQDPRFQEEQRRGTLYQFSYCREPLLPAPGLCDQTCLHVDQMSPKRVYCSHGNERNMTFRSGDTPLNSPSERPSCTTASHQMDPNGPNWLSWATSSITVEEREVRSLCGPLTWGGLLDMVGLHTPTALRPLPYALYTYDYECAQCCWDDLIGCERVHVFYCLLYYSSCGVCLFLQCFILNDFNPSGITLFISLYMYDDINDILFYSIWTMSSQDMQCAFFTKVNSHIV